MLILGLESSCDETAAAIVEDGVRVRADVVASQHALHRPYRGVVPEIASRAHLETILPTIRAALAEARIDLDDLDAVAAGVRPGLIGSLLVGTSAAKGLAWGLDLPFIAVDHVEAHLYAGRLEAEPVGTPAFGLVVSGGHTSFFRLGACGVERRLGRSIDDAAGEAFDKAAAMIGLDHPGGPKLAALASDGDDGRFDLPRPTLDRRRFDVSFSGLKTAFRRTVLHLLGLDDPATDPRGHADRLSERDRADLAASFEAAAIDTLLAKVRLGLEGESDGPTYRSVVAGGGVVSNRRLRDGLVGLADRHGVDLRLPRAAWCVDNAAMIAGAAFPRVAAGESDPLDTAAEPLSIWSRPDATDSR
ncbi:MAG: tRNA (adenosine(37)-N6)-threonylcarbamoyltransferase complex transferase subunit TsaD [Planctomycetota bacterium]|jgi:N6-L-threonylcarbamoyladenine synthase